MTYNPYFVHTLFETIERGPRPATKLMENGSWYTDITPG